MTGGNQNNTFTFDDGSSLSGVIIGGSGNATFTNTLDYSKYESPVVVNLANHSASYINGNNSNGFVLPSRTWSATTVRPDSLIGTACDNVWNLTANNTDTGTVGAFAFTGVANLVGNVGNDTFNFNHNSAVSGSIDGGASGVNTMNFTNYGSPVTVTLSGPGTGSATPIADDGPNGFANMTAVTASNGTLGGANSSNLWLITGNNSGTVNGFAFSGMAHLVGNYQDDTFRVQPAKRVLAAASTAARARTFSRMAPTKAPTSIRPTMRHGVTTP